MLSLDQIIEFYDEHQANGQSRFALDERQLTETARQTEVKRQAHQKETLRILRCSHH